MLMNILNIKTYQVALLLAARGIYINLLYSDSFYINKSRIPGWVNS